VTFDERHFRAQRSLKGPRQGQSRLIPPQSLVRSGLLGEPVAGKPVPSNPLTSGKFLVDYPWLFGKIISKVGCVRDDELRRILTHSNPWWRAAAAGTNPAAWTAGHRLLRERLKHDLGYRADVLDDIATEPVEDSLVVLAGPRRVGKSVVLVDTAAVLCARDDVDPRQVIHVPCDGMKDRDLRRVLTLARDQTRSIDLDRPRPRVWLFDEISGVRGWTAVLKSARDGTSFGDDTVVATGSRWVKNEDVAANLFAGRAGTGSARRLRQLPPMSFRDYLSASGRQLALLPVTHPADLQSAAVDAALTAVAFDVDAYDLAWQEYLTCGGYPRAVAEHLRTGAVTDAYLKDLEAWLRSDVDPDAPPESVPRLLVELSRRATSPLNATTTARDLGYASRANFDLRLSRLRNSFATLTCPHRSDSGVAVVGSQSKVYLTDPLLAWLPGRLHSGLPTPDMTRLAEMSLGVAQAHAIDQLEEGRWLAGETIGYALTGSGNEVDLAPVEVPVNGGVVRTVPVESKWVDDGWRGEARVIEGKYGRGILATKSVLRTEGAVWAVPAPLVALLLR